MRKILGHLMILLFGIYCTSCYFGANDWYGHISKDFYKSCWDEHCKIMHSKGDTPSFFDGIIVDKTVFAIGNNDQFIIAKQHPHKDKEISDRLFKKSFSTVTYKWYYELTTPADTVFLTPEDSIFSFEGKWYHTKDKWTDPDSLKPYKRKTLYHIIDIRWYPNHGYKVYTFDNEKDFNTKRFILGVPKDLPYEFYGKDWE